MSDVIATITLNTDDIIADIPRTIFGGFAEHMGRCVYQGIYDPDSKLSDEHGFRRDVIDALHEMRLSVLRYPGGGTIPVSVSTAWQ